MPDPLIGVVSCSGECCGFGTLSRIATRILMEEYRKNCITICLPLFSIGDHDENDFAMKFPTITIDGCTKRCATISTEKLSGPVQAQLEVTGQLAEWGLDMEFNKRELGPAGLETARRLAEVLAEKVDVIVQAKIG